MSVVGFFPVNSFPNLNLKMMDTPILKGEQIFHNFIRPHMALHGTTPADKAGIEIKGENKWITIIQNASKKEDTKIT